MSPGFRSSRNLAAFLQHVVERTLAGRGEDIKEYSIAVEVFGRSEAFDPRNDGVVRVQAGHLRKKLGAYYQKEGAFDEVIISVPRGAYVPEFSARRIQTPPETKPLPKWRPGWLVKLAFGMGGLLLGAMGATWLWLGRAPVAEQQDNTGITAKADQPPAPSLGSLWAPFLTGDHDVVLALGVPQFFSAGNVLMRDVRVNAADDVAAESPLHQLSRSVGAPLKEIEVYTGIGEAAGAMAVGQFYTRHARLDRPLRFLRSRLVGWQELRASHVIFLASMRFRTMADELGLPTRFRLDASGDWIEHIAEKAAQPLAAAPNWEYATIVAAPGKVAGRRVLLVRGRNTWATQGAAEYITNHNSLEQLEKRLSAHPVKPDAFEVLLRVEVRDDQPVAVEYLRHHPLLLRPERP